MAGSSNVTTDHATIRKWAEERGGKPATVVGTGGSGAGLLRIDFPGRRGKGSLEEISWEEFFEKFEEKNLALLYQEKTAGGKISRFSKIISRETAEKNRGSIDSKERKSDQARAKSKSNSSFSPEEDDEYASLFSKDIEELHHLAEDKHIPDLDEFDKEELIMAIEIADLAGEEETDNYDNY